MKLKISLFFQSPFNVLLFRHLNPRMAQKYLHGIGFVYYLLNRKEKRVIERNVRQVLMEQEERYIRKVIRQTFKGIFSHYFEKMFGAFLDCDKVSTYVKRHLTVEGGELLSRALEKGKGCILVTAHWGAVEFIPWVMFCEGFPSSVILECATTRLARSLQAKTGRTNTELISSGRGVSVFVRALHSLQANRVLMTQCDEVDTWRRHGNHTIHLLGRDMVFDNTIDVLAHRSGAPVIGAFLKRVGPNRYTLILEDVSVVRQPESTARECLSLWEKYVTRYPEQWYQWKKLDAMTA
ncbi:MAG TPA: lysophospholipid acyltransferase family protein [Spirochaetia bacterium]|nr:lysophospholipid acyltransferase family protein [Spirochaetia bacterium]